MPRHTGFKLKPPKTKITLIQANEIIKNEFFNVFGFNCISVSSHLEARWFSAIAKPYNVIIQTLPSNLNLPETEFADIIKSSILMKYQLLVSANII